MERVLVVMRSSHRVNLCVMNLSLEFMCDECIYLCCWFSYLLFLSGLSQIQARMPQLGFPEIGRLLGQAWRDLEDKKRYVDGSLSS